MQVRTMVQAQIRRRPPKFAPGRRDCPQYCPHSTGILTGMCSRPSVGTRPSATIPRGHATERRDANALETRLAAHASRSERIRRSGPTQASRRAIGSVGGPPANDVLGHREVDHPTRRHEHRAGQLVGRADRAEDDNIVNTWVPAPSASRSRGSSTRRSWGSRVGVSQRQPGGCSPALPSRR
jgi:hypothetical protein